MLGFEELTEARRELQSFCLLHVPSLLAVRSGISFKLLPTDPNLGKRRVRHMTTTATCLNSLSDCPSWFRGPEFDLQEMLEQFARGALKRRKWTSEGSAGVYCRCRALPTVIRCITKLDQRIRGHVLAILHQLKAVPGRFAIGEAGADLEKEQWYPPNAFHTYWALEILSLLEDRFPHEYNQLGRQIGLDLARIRNGMLLWSRQQLGHQIGLHSAPASSMLDSDQLAWSLATFLRFDKSVTVNLETRDFIKQALTCLFSTQTDGTWRHYKPLFHYKRAGNAYCYVFETFAVLLQCALAETAEAEMFRDLLQPYGDKLKQLWAYAQSTKIPLAVGSRDVGWCSGHRTNVTLPESWATASVFSYAQALRRLVGVWCRDEARSKLNTPRRRLATKAARQEINSRGRTWGSGKVPVSDRLWTMFINPIRMHECTDKLEPDSQPIAKDHARSAILFGPPGTSKTTLVRSVADVLEWQYVEIHASHFVAAGLTQVQKTADTIFRQLLELDHTVVLFDEIDELVREREMEEDAFGRFLTTSMLPKLAELWAARKILYFVATNHINYFDSAIIRSHRFDALVLVSPPSFKAKVQELKRLLLKNYGFAVDRFEVTERQIESSLEGIEKKDRERRGTGASGSQSSLSDWLGAPVPTEFVLAKFALLRWDELGELATRLWHRLKTSPGYKRRITKELLRVALGDVGDAEWRKTKSYLDYLRDVRSERRDYQMLDVWECNRRPADNLRALFSAPESSFVAANGRLWFAKSVEAFQDIEVPGLALRFGHLGRVQVQRARSTGR